jgi:hypothetical protein
VRTRSGNEDEPDEVAVLRAQLHAAEEKIANLTSASLDSLAAYNALAELSNKPAASKGNRQIMMPFFSYGNNDDDDLPN